MVERHNQILWANVVGFNGVIMTSSLMPLL